jgi:hypothetical protein
MVCTHQRSESLRRFGIPLQRDEATPTSNSCQYLIQALHAITITSWFGSAAETV